jgi:hypothetical protein
LRNSRGKATKDNCCNCQVVNEKTLANEWHTPIIRYIRFSQNARISSKRLRSRSHVRIVLGRPKVRRFIPILWDHFIVQATINTLRAWLCSCG